MGPHMNTIERYAINGEILPPQLTVRVVGRTHPLAGDRVVRDVAAGMSIAEILDECAGPRYGAGFIVHLDGHVIAPENFHKVRVKAGVTMTFLPRLQGNGGVWKSVLAVVVAVAAAVIAPQLAPGLVTAFATAGLTISATTAAGLIAGSVCLAGRTALAALKFQDERPRVSPGRRLADLRFGTDDGAGLRR